VLFPKTKFTRQTLCGRLLCFKMYFLREAQVFANKRQFARLSANLFLLVAGALTLSSPLCAFAAPVELRQAADGKAAQGALILPVVSIGSLLLPSGQITVDGQNVEVGAVPEWLFDRHTVLTGVLIQLDVAGAAASPAATSLNGLVYFNGGDWLKNLRRGRAKETIETADGQTYQGQIVSVTKDQISIDTLPGQSRNIALANVKNIISPCSYRFSAPASQVKLSPDTGITICDARSVTFAPAGAQPRLASAFSMRGSSSTPALKLPKSDLAGTEGGITKRAIALMITADAVNTIAPAIAIPLTATLGQRRASNTLNGYTEANLLNDFVFKIPLVTSPTARF